MHSPMTTEHTQLVEHIDWKKTGNLIPAIIQHSNTLQVLMLGFMNQEALTATLNTQRVTFYSRTKERLWVKGETSGHYLEFKNIQLDCDQDSLLITAIPHGPTCHLQRTSCFNHHTAPGVGLIAELVRIVDKRFQHPEPKSYTSQLFQDGIYRCAQKVGEEGVEVALAAVKGDKSELAEESADLLFHLLVTLRKSELDFNKVLDVLRQRMIKHENR